MKTLRWIDKRLVAIVAAVLALVVLGDLAIRTTVEDVWYADSAVVSEGALPAMAGDIVIEQPNVIIPCDALERITCWTTIDSAAENGRAVLEVIQNGQTIRSAEVPAAAIANNGMTVFNFPPIENGKNQQVTLRIWSEGLDAANVRFYYGTVYDSGKVQISDTSGMKVYANNEEYAGKMCFTLQGNDHPNSYAFYWPVCLLLMAGTVCVWVQFRREQSDGKCKRRLRKVHEFYDYRFLIKQLVIRDFKIKYKRSVLGVLWSFINPLLTMLVQFFVFSQLFNNTVNNYPVYLMAGGILFSYMQECVDLGMNSITGNRDLINKVHIPLEIFPISRVISSLINLGISLLPLLIMMVVTKVRFTLALVYVPYVLCTLALFCIGLGLLFSAAMVFFRDMRFLWSVFSSFWMYLTPIFYSEDIIASQFLTIYRMNPMYQFLTFFRAIVLESTVPEPGLFFGCALSAVIACGLGAWAFHANKKKFFLYL